MMDPASRPPLRISTTRADAKTGGGFVQDDGKVRVCVEGVGQTGVGTASCRLHDCFSPTCLRRGGPVRLPLQPTAHRANVVK